MSKYRMGKFGGGGRYRLQCDWKNSMKLWEKNIKWQREGREEINVSEQFGALSCRRSSM